MRAVRRVVVAGRQVDVALDAVALAPHHQRHLAVGLEADEAVDDVHARLLERARPLDVGRLVEARLELDDRGHLLAVLGGADQRAHDRRVGAGAVERLLDREHVRIVGRLGDELDDVLERLVGMVQQDVALADDRGRCRRTPAAAARSAAKTARRGTRAAPRASRCGARSARCSGPVEQVDVVRLQAQRRAQEGRRTSVGVSWAISSRTALPRSRRRSSFWIVFSRSSASSSSIERSKLRVTRNGAAAEDAEAGEQLARVHRDQILEHHEREAGRWVDAKRRCCAPAAAAAPRSTAAARTAPGRRRPSPRGGAPSPFRGA